MWSLSWSDDDERPLSDLGLADTVWGLGREEDVSSTLLALALTSGGVPSRAEGEVLLLEVLLASARSTVCFQGSVLPILAWLFGQSKKIKKENSIM